MQGRNMSDKSNNEVIPGPPPLVDLLELGIEEEIKKDEEGRKQGKIKRFPLSPSKFGQCARLTAIELAEFEKLGIWPLELLDPRAVRRFSRGYDIEYSLLKQYKKYVPIDQAFGQQYLTMDKTPDDKYVIGGSLDTMFLTEEPMIVDIKSKATFYSSAHSDSFEEMFSNIADMPGVKTFGNRALYIEDIDSFYATFTKDDFTSRYFLQLNAYGACDWAVDFKSNLYPNVCGVKVVALLFENKNNHIMGEIRWKPSRTLYEYAIQKMKDIYQWVVIDKKDPAQYEPEFTLGSTACRLCPRKAVCWADTRHPYNGPKKEWPTDTHALQNKIKLEEAYNKYKTLIPAVNQSENCSQDLINQIHLSGKRKVRFSDGKVYEIKELKTPKRHYVLRESK